MKAIRNNTVNTFRFGPWFTGRSSAVISLIFLFGTLALVEAQSPQAVHGRGSASLRANRLGGAATELFDGKEVVSGQVIVKPLASTSMTAQKLTLRKIERLARGQVLRELGGIGAFLVESKMKSVAAAVKAIKASGIAEYVEPNFVVHMMRNPNDPKFSQQWGMNKIQAPQAWDQYTGSRTFSVGVVDTGVDYKHEDLAANIWTASADFDVTLNGHTQTCPKGSHGYNAITHQCTAAATMDDNGHGTAVAGIIGAVGNNGIGMAGVNWTASIIVIKFLDSQGSGSVASAMDAIEFAIQLNKAGVGANIRVLNNSWGGVVDSVALHNQVIRTKDFDLLFVAAAGLGGTDNDVDPFYPGSYDSPNIIAVTDTGMIDNLPNSSNYGLTRVHLGAPGVGILSTTIGPLKYRPDAGSSLAVAHVSGAALLVLSRCAINTDALKRTILDNVDLVPPLAGKTVTGGRLNAYKAVTNASPCPSDKSSDASESTARLIAPRYIYVTNATDASISRFRVNMNGTTGSEIRPRVCTGAVRPNCNDGATPWSVVADPLGRFLYVVNLNFSNILTFRINAATGGLTRIGSICTTAGAPPCARTGPRNIMLDRSGTVAYVINQTTNSISAFLINPTSGALSPIAGSPFPTGNAPARMALDRSGKFAYITNRADNSIWTYSIDPSTGSLMRNGSNTVGKSPTSLVADPSGDFLYALNSGDANISTFAINPQDGALKSVDVPICARIKTDTQCANTEPQDLAIDQHGKFLYVSNRRISAAKGGVSAFSIGPNGALTRLSGASVDFFDHPSFMRFEPSDKFLYMLGTNSLLAYKFDPVTGSVVSLSSGTVGGGVNSLNSLSVVGY